MDYTKPIQQAWTLKNNWAAGVDPYYTTGQNEWNALRSVTTLTNGHVYGIIRDSRAGNRNVVVELPQPANTILRICQDSPTGLHGNELALPIIDQAATGFHTFNQPAWLSPDGSLRYPKWSVPTSPQIEFWEKTLLGFDQYNNPLWNAEVKVASAPYKDTDPLIVREVRCKHCFLTKLPPEVEFGAVTGFLRRVEFDLRHSARRD